ncbi:efflux RND transporter periplasmic adaptor subunit [Arenimonas alkanexedens]
MSAIALPSRLLLILAALALGACASDVPPEGPARPALVVQPTSASEVLSAYAGEVRARHEPDLAFRIGGKITRVQVDVGQAVEKGQVLAELDASDVGLQLESARAALASAESDHALATSELERYQSLLDRQLVSRSLYDARVSALQAAEARVRQARAEARVSDNQASYAVLRAPGDGVVAQRLAEAGQVVAAGQTVFMLAEDGDREVLISVPEQSAADFSPGRALAVELWSTPGVRLPATLREISPAADAQARTFAARVSFDAGEARAELGQSARVYALSSGEAALSVPLSALHQKDGEPALWVVDPATSTVSLRPVRTGDFGETRVPVLSGLQADEWFVAAGVHLLLEGQRIQPIDRENRPVSIASAAAPAAN